VIVKVENTTIKPLEHTRYLGIIIDKRLKWRTHLEHIEKKIAPWIGLLRYLARSAYEPNNKIMINIYKWLVRTIIVHGSPVLLTADQKVWDRLQICQNKAIRAALGLPINKIYTHDQPTPKYAVEILQKTIQTTTTSH